jgi:PAS domain S-box-containing protein
MDASLSAVGIGPAARLRAAIETQIDPHVLLLAVRGEADRIVDFEYVDANRAACEFLGMPFDEVVGSRLIDRLAEDGGPGLLAMYAAVVDTGEELVLDDYAYQPEQGVGDAQRFDIRARKVGDALSCSWRDVTEWSRAAARFEAVAENAADVVLLLREGAVQWVSPSVAEVLGWRPEECVGHPGDFLVHPDDVDLMLRARASLYGGGVTRIRLRHLHKDGGIVWCESRGRAITGPDGEVQGAVVSIRDVSEQVELEEERQAAEARYRLVAEHASDVVYVVDPDGDLAWVSPSIESVLGWDPEDLVGTPVGLIVAAEDIAAREEGRRAVFGEARTHEPVEIRFRTSTGLLRWMALRADPVFDAHGNVTSAVCSLRLCQSEVVERWAAATLSAGNALLAKATDEEELLNEMCETAVRCGGYRFAWFGRKVDAPGKPVVPVACSQADRDYVDGLVVSWDDVPSGRGPTGRALRSGETAIEADLLADQEFAPWKDRARARGFRSSISLPVRVNGVVEGSFAVYADEPRAFEPRVVRLLEDLVRSLGFGIDRLRDRRDLEVAFANSIDLVASVVESRDPYTAGHQARVAELSAAMGRELDLSERRIEGLTYAATIHDAGKVGVPIDLLSRPGKLAEEEMTLIRRHSRIGWEITSKFDWPWPVADIVHQHHERMDGSGYPQGLRGDEILLESRIVAVADVYEAVSSRRPYRAALGEGKARAAVVDESGTLFDADVVDAFVRVLDAGFTFSATKAEG